MRSILAFALASLLVFLAQPRGALAASGFSVAPSSVSVAVPSDGSTVFSVFITSTLDGEIVVAPRVFPFESSLGRLRPAKMIGAGDKADVVRRQLRGTRIILWQAHLRCLRWRQRGSRREDKRGRYQEGPEIGRRGLLDALKDNYLLVTVGVLLLAVLGVGIAVLAKRRGRAA